MYVIKVIVSIRTSDPKSVQICKNLIRLSFRTAYFCWSGIQFSQRLHRYRIKPGMTSFLWDSSDTLLEHIFTLTPNLYMPIWSRYGRFSDHSVFLKPFPNTVRLTPLPWFFKARLIKQSLRTSLPQSNPDTLWRSVKTARAYLFPRRRLGPSMFWGVHYQAESLNWSGNARSPAQSTNNRIYQTH